jgi:hypothetical protein
MPFPSTYAINKPSAYFSIYVHYSSKTSILCFTMRVDILDISTVCYGRLPLPSTPGNSHAQDLLKMGVKHLLSLRYYEHVV